MSTRSTTRMSICMKMIEKSAWGRLKRKRGVSLLRAKDLVDPKALLNGRSECSIKFSDWKTAKSAFRSMSEWLLRNQGLSAWSGKTSKLFQICLEQTQLNMKVHQRRQSMAKPWCHHKEPTLPTITRQWWNRSWSAQDVEKKSDRRMPSILQI